VGYWAVLVYLPLFLGTGFGWTAKAAGLGLLAATLPMLVIPPFGGRLASRLGWRRLFASALTLIAIGGCALAVAALTEPRVLALTWTFGGMMLIGTGAALSHPQLSGAVVTLHLIARMHGKHSQAVTPLDLLETLHLIVRMGLERRT